MNSSKASTCCLLRSAIYSSVSPSGIVRYYSGFSGDVNGLEDRVLYTASLTMRAR